MACLRSKRAGFSQCQGPRWSERASKYAWKALKAGVSAGLGFRALSPKAMH